MRDPRVELEQSYRRALAECDPAKLVAASLPRERPTMLLALGKAARPMIAEARRAYPDLPWLATPPANDDTELPAAGAPAAEAASAPGTAASFPLAASLLEGGFAHGSHPHPDDRSVAAAGRALALASGLDDDDHLLVLISGGGSALWCAPWGPLPFTPASGGDEPAPYPRGVDLVVKSGVSAALMRAGADIRELNVVRRHLSRIKGGRLAAAGRAKVTTLALSDVPGDHLVDIASGPTVADPTTFEEALAVMNRYGVSEPAAVRHLEAGAAGLVSETPKPGSPADERSSAHVIGSSRILLSAAADYWRGRGCLVAPLSAALQGDVRELAAAHVDLVLALRPDLATGSASTAGGAPDLALALERLVERPGDRRELMTHLAGWRAAAERAPRLVLLSGGEATVNVKGSGRGGRNLEFAAWLLAEFGRRTTVGGSGAPGHVLAESAEKFGIWALSAGSDGVDGSSSAAGAFVTPDSLQRARKLGIEIDELLENNDTDTLFGLLGDRFVTGPTGNNLNDYRALLVSPLTM